MKLTRRLAIIGGGAAGFFCAATLAEMISPESLEITIFEALDKPLLKLLASGGGRCNLTNNVEDPMVLARHYPRGEKFLYSVFRRFSARDTIEWFEKRGLKLYTNDENCVFPVCESAKAVADLLIIEAGKGKTVLRANMPVMSLMYTEGRFLVGTRSFEGEFDFVLLAIWGL